MEKGTFFAISVPNYCAGCGNKLNITGHSRFDFIHGNSFSCSCGVQFIQVDESQLDEEITEELNRY